MTESRRLLLYPLLALVVSIASPFVRGAAAAPASDSTVQSLAGEWRFALDRADAGVNERWFDRALSDRITLPGVLQAQGYGDEISTDTPWVLGLGDAWWKLQPESLRARFSQPGKVEVPFLSQPPRHYLGAAWYQRDIDVSEAESGKRHVLFLERAHWETTVWVDDKRYDANNSLVAPHVTDLGVLKPGRHRLTVRVDNRQIVRDPKQDGHGVDAHAVSDALGATWNGIVGRIELQATPLTWLDDVQVFPNAAKRTALVKVTLGNATGRPGSGTLRAGDVSAPVSWTEAGGSAELEVPLGSNAELWSEFKPAMQSVTVSLSAPGIADSQTVRFGLRDVSWNDKDLLVNGRVVNIRSTHFGGDFPLTGHPAMDVAEWKRIIRACQDFGMNGMRFHSWCPPEAAFTAADELGFYLQPECGLWAPFTVDGVYTKYLEEETPRLLKAYGNHPSFVLFSPSNEPSGAYTQITPQWAADWYKKDPRRLFAAGTGWGAREQVTGGTQFAILIGYGRSIFRGESGWFGRDYRAGLDTAHIPVLAHESGQWCAYPDFDIIDEFTGYMRPGNYRIFRAIAEQTGVLEYNKAFALASGRFQALCYKEEIEANLRTPGMAGYQLLDLHDYLGQGTALIGVLNAFWKPKGYISAEQFRRFNDRTVALARLAKRTYTTDEVLTADAELYHFGEAPLTNASAFWKIVDAKGQAKVEGRFEARDLPIGKNLPLGKIEAALRELPAPAAYKLVVGLAGTKVANDWDFWVYPAAIDATVPKDVVVTSNWAEARDRLAAGGSVLFLPTEQFFPSGRSPKMSRTPVFWNVQMTVRPPRNPNPRFDTMLGLLVDSKHPALAAFPTEAHCDWQWTPLISGVRSVNLNDAPRELRPIVATIDDWNRNWRLGVVFECNVGPGRLLVSTIPLQKPEATPGAKQLRRSLLDYMAGDRFRPTATLTPAQARQLWMAPPGTAPAPGQRVFDPDLNDGTGSAQF